MKKFLGIILLSFILLTLPAKSGTKGKGEVKVSDRTVSHFKDYLSGKIVKGERWTPSVFILSSDGEWSFYYYCPYTSCVDRGGNKKKIKECERETNEHCGVFAQRRTVIWDNGNDFPTREKRFNSKWDLAKVKSQLEKLGFYDGGNTQTKKIEKKETSQTNDANDITKQLKNLIEMYESGTITKEEFKKAKKKLLD